MLSNEKSGMTNLINITLYGETQTCLYIGLILQILFIVLFFYYLLYYIAEWISNNSQKIIYQ